MKSIWVLVLIGLCGGLVSCTQGLDHYPQNLRLNAPQHARDTGWILKGLEEAQLVRLIQRFPKVKVRPVHRGLGWYEVFGLTRAEMTAAFPSAELLSNYFIPRPFANDSFVSPLGAEVRNCLQGPLPPSAVISVADQTSADWKPVMELGGVIRVTGMKSPEAATLKMAWIVSPPQSSLQSHMIVQNSVLEFRPDAYGVYEIGLVVQDEKGFCGFSRERLVVTGNPSLNRSTPVNPGLREALDLNRFNHLRELEAEAAWEKSTGIGQLIAIIDTGVNYNHRSLQGNLELNENEIEGNGIDDDQNGLVDDYLGYDFANSDPRPYDDDGHGSHVAGLAAATDFGLAKEARILAIKSMGPQGGDIASIAASIHYALDRGARVINLSLGSYGPPHPLLIAAIEAAEAKNVVIVAASGNGHPQTGLGLNTDVTPNYPSALPNANIIAVAAIDRAGKLARYSNYGAKSVDIAAPGGKDQSELIFSAYTDNPRNHEYVGLAGTSMAAPIVAGIAAQVLSLRPNLSAPAVVEILRQSGVEQAELKDLLSSGRIINARMAVDQAGL